MAKVGRFHKHPTEIYLFALAVAHLLTAQAPTVRSKVADTGTSPDISGLP